MKSQLITQKVSESIGLEKLILIVSSFTFVFMLSCSNHNQQEQTEIVDSLNIEKTVISNEKPFSDTVWIKDKEEQFLLKVLTMLPDSAMGTSWKWSIQEREQMVDEGIKRGYLINDSECCHRKKIKSKYNFFTTVVDGNWEMALFKISEENFIIITDERVGDGDNLYAFELNGDKLIAISESELIPQGIWRFLHKTPLFSSDEEEISFYEKSRNTSVFLDYSFLSDKIIIGIYLSDGYTQQNNKIYKGNRLDLNFNKETKRFDVGKIYWEKENDN